MGVKLDRSLFMVTIFVRFLQYWLRLKQLGIVFKQLQQTPQVKAKQTIECIPIVITHHRQIMFFIKHNNVQIYTLIFFWFVNITPGKVPQYGVCLSLGPINMGMIF